MSKSRMCLSALACIAIIGLVLTLQQGTAPVDVVITVTVDYDGDSIGSLALTYHWKSKQLDVDTEYQEIDWQSDTVSATSSPTNQIERTIVEYLQEGSTQTSLPCWIRLYEDGSWELGFRVSIGEIPITLTFTGTGPLVDNVSLSGDVSLIPPGLKSELQDMGISGLDIKVGWKLVISQDFLVRWAANIFEVFRWIGEGISDVGELVLGSIDF